MFKLYDTAFKVGFGFTVLVFAILNIASYSVAKDEQLKRGGIEFSNYLGLSWGFPFNMTRPETFSLNVLIIVGCGFIVGIIFKFVWSRISSKPLK